MKARCAVLLSVVLVCTPAFAQLATQVAIFPAKPVHMVIPFPPGGAVDILGRAMGAELSKSWGQPVLIDSKPGAAGVVAAAAVARAAPDGYTIFLTDQTPLAISPFMQRDLPYNHMKDFAPVIALVQSSGILVVPGNSPISTTAELIAAAKARPGALNFGSWGIGSTAHLDPEDFASRAGISLTHVPYKGLAELSRGVLAGEIQLAFISLGAAMPLIRDGRFKALAYGGLKRSTLVPDVPTLAETVLPGFQTRSWLGFIAPAATPRPIVNRIAADSARVLTMQPFVDKFIVGVGFEVASVPPEPFAQLIDETRTEKEAQLRRLKLAVN